MLSHPIPSLQFTRNKSILTKYMHEQAAHIIAKWVVELDFKLKIKKERTTKYGDYRPPISNTNHQITINRDLNQHAFLITMVHEIAHLTCWNKFKNKAKPHGSEWKQEFKVLMQPFFALGIFPDDIHHALLKYMQNPAASSCSDIHLMRTLKKYDTAKDGIVLLEKLPTHTIFKIKNGRHFQKGIKRRTRYICTELETKRMFLFSAMAEVIEVSNG